MFSFICFRHQNSQFHGLLDFLFPRHYKFLIWPRRVNNIL